MKANSSFWSFISFTILMALIVSPVAYSQSGAVKLVYNYPSDKAVRYLSVSKILQTMDVTGQVLEVKITSALGCSIKSKGIVNKNINLEVRIDTMYQSIDSPQGAAGGVVRDAMGKVFSMRISPEGKEVDLSEAGKIAIIIEGSGATDASQSFIDFFPDMPIGLVSPGFKWSETDTSKTKSLTNSEVAVTISDNKFEGYENVGGVKCAKITSVFSGNRVIVTQSQGMDITLKGPFTGSIVLFFSPEKGYFLKQTATMKLKGTIEITSPDNMSFPVVMDVTSVNEVVK